MIEQGAGSYIILFMVLVVLYVLALYIPFYLFTRKRWKGLAIGCLIQPVVCLIASFFVVGGVYLYWKHYYVSQREAAMVSVRKTDAEGKTHTWYLKTNDECYYECKGKKRTSSLVLPDDVKLFDIVPLDSMAVCVDDVIVVRFDPDKHKVTATQYDEPIDVVSVDWDRVKTYFQQ